MKRTGDTSEDVRSWFSRRLSGSCKRTALFLIAIQSQPCIWPSSPERQRDLIPSAQHDIPPHCRHFHQFKFRNVYFSKMRMLARACNLSTKEAGAGESKVQGHGRLQSRVETTLDSRRHCLGKAKTQMSVRESISHLERRHR